MFCNFGPFEFSLLVFYFQPLCKWNPLGAVGAKVSVSWKIYSPPPPPPSPGGHCFSPFS